MNEKQKKNLKTNEKSKTKESKVTKSKIETNDKTIAANNSGVATVTKPENPVIKFFKMIGTWFSKLKLWVRVLILVLSPIIFILIGILVTLRGLLWYSPVSPVSKLFESREAHLFFEGTRLYSFSHEVDYDMDVIYDNGKDNKYTNLGITSKKAAKLDIPLEVEKIEIKVHESKNTKGDAIKNYDKIYKRKADNPNIFVVSGGSITVKSKVESKDTLDLSNALDKSKKDKTSDEQKFVSAVFMKKEPLDIVKDLGKSVSKAKLVVDENSYKDYDTYAKGHSKDTDIHQIYWHATAETHLKGQESSVKKIEKHVLNRVVEFTYNYNGKDYDVFLIKSDNGNDPTLGVKYGLLLSTNGYTFAGMAIDGKDWIKENDMAAAPANDTLGIYTVIVKSNTSDAQSLAAQLASDIGGVN